MSIATNINTTKGGGLSLGKKGNRLGSSTMRIENHEQLSQLLRGIPESLHSYIVINSFAKALHPMRKKIKANAPRHTGTRTHRNTTYKPGNLRRAIKIGRSKRRKSLWASVYVAQGRGMPDGWYARFFEWGTVGRLGAASEQRNARKYHRFFSRGIESTRKQVQDNATKGLQQIMDKEIDKQLNRYHRKATKMLMDVTF